MNPATNSLLICGREGDFYKLFTECGSLKLPLLVRLTQKRSSKEKVQNEGKIFDALRAVGSVGEMENTVNWNPVKKWKKRFNGF